MLPPPLQPFRFLDLPPELRLMVYERIQPRTSYHVLDDGIFHRNAPLALAAHKELGNDPRKYALKVTLVVRSIDLSILVTCRQIYMEAKQPLLQNLAIDPVRLISSAACVFTLCHPQGFLFTALVEAGLLPWDRYPESPLSDHFVQSTRNTRRTPWLSSCDPKPHVLSFIIKLASVMSRAHRFRLQGPRQSRHIELAVYREPWHTMIMSLRSLKYLRSTYGMCMQMGVRMRPCLPDWVGPISGLLPEVLLLTEPIEDDFDRLLESMEYLMYGTPSDRLL